MTLLKFRVSDETFTRLVEVAATERRPLDMQAEWLLMRSLGVSGGGESDARGCQVKPDEFLRLGDYRVNPNVISCIQFDVTELDEDGTESVQDLIDWTFGEPHIVLALRVGSRASDALRTYFGYPEPAE